MIKPKSKNEYISYCDLNNNYINPYHKETDPTNKEKQLIQNLNEISTYTKKTTNEVVKHNKKVYENLNNIYKQIKKNKTALKQLEKPFKQLDKPKQKDKDITKQNTLLQWNSNKDIIFHTKIFNNTDIKQALISNDMFKIISNKENILSLPPDVKVLTFRNTDYSTTQNINPFNTRFETFGYPFANIRKETINLKSKDRMIITHHKQLGFKTKINKNNSYTEFKFIVKPKYILKVMKEYYKIINLPYKTNRRYPRLNTIINNIKTITLKDLTNMLYRIIQEIENNNPLMFRKYENDKIKNIPRYNKFQLLQDITLITKYGYYGEYITTKNNKTIFSYYNYYIPKTIRTSKLTDKNQIQQKDLTKWVKQNNRIYNNNKTLNTTDKNQDIDMLQIIGLKGNSKTTNNLKPKQKEIKIKPIKTPIKSIFDNKIIGYYNR